MTSIDQAMREAKQAQADVAAFREMVSKTKADFEAGLAELETIVAELRTRKTVIELLDEQAGSAETTATRAANRGSEMQSILDLVMNAGTPRAHWHKDTTRETGKQYEKYISALRNGPSPSAYAHLVDERLRSRGY